MRKLIAAATAALILGIAAPAAHADTVASFNGCTYTGTSYMDVVQQWWAAGEPSCGAGYVLSVSTTLTVSGTVPPTGTAPGSGTDTYGKG
jgi:hypothetical protein